MIYRNRTTGNPIHRVYNQKHVYLVTIQDICLVFYPICLLILQSKMSAQSKIQDMSTQSAVQNVCLVYNPVCLPSLKSKMCAQSTIQDVCLFYNPRCLPSLQSKMSTYSTIQDICYSIHVMARDRVSQILSRL